MASKNNFEIEIYQTVYQKEGLQFIILPRIILPEITTISILLNDVNTRPSLNGQPHSYIASKSR